MSGQTDNINRDKNLEKESNKVMDLKGTITKKKNLLEKSTVDLK